MKCNARQGRKTRRDEHQQTWKEEQSSPSGNERTIWGGGGAWWSLQHLCTLCVIIRIICKRTAAGWCMDKEQRPALAC